MQRLDVDAIYLGYVKPELALAEELDKILAAGQVVSVVRHGKIAGMLIPISDWQPVRTT